MDEISQFSVQNSSAHRIAPIVDRLIAVVLDFLLFAPFCTLVLAQIFRRIEYFYQVSPQSIEFYVLVAVAAVFSLILAVLFQAVFLMNWGRTPGQYFLKLKIVDLHHPETKISANQALLRSCLMVIQMVIVFPWFEVLSHPLRRALHDRASETVVVTLKEQGDLGPHPLESTAIRQLLFLLCVAMSFMFITSVGFVYRMALHGEFKKTELMKDQYLCESVSTHVGEEENRIDKAIALYLADRISADCLTAEADFSFWQPDTRNQIWGYLAKSILYRESSDKAESYLKKVCEIDPNSEPCEITKQMERTEVAGTFKSVTGNMILLESLFAQNKFQQAAEVARELGRNSGLQGKALEKLVKVEWLSEKYGRALGALDAANGFIDVDTQDEIASWICHEELQKGCQSIQPACDILAKDFQQTPERDTDNIVVGLALVQLQSCRPDLELSPTVMQRLRDEKPSFAKLETLKLKRHQLTETQVEQAFKKIASSTEKSPFMRYFATLEWLKMNEDSKQLRDFFEDNKQQHFSAYQSFRMLSLAVEKALMMNQSAMALSFTQQMPKVFYDRTDFKELLAMAHLAVGEREQAEEVLASIEADQSTESQSFQTNSSRSPANANKLFELRTQIKQIRNLGPAGPEIKAAPKSRVQK